MEQILNSENKVLSKGTQVSFALDEIYSNYPISVNISGNWSGSISGSCGENVTGDIFTAGVYEIPAGQNSKNFSAKLTNKCSSIDATLSLTVSNGALYCTVDYTFQGHLWRGMCRGRFPLRKFIRKFRVMYLVIRLVLKATLTR